VERGAAIALMRRTLDMVERQWPETADAYMKVPLAYYQDKTFAARERALFETSPLALLASSEIAHAHDYFVRNAVGRSILITRDGDGVAHAFLNYCRHRGAEPTQGCGNRRTFSCPYHAWTYDSRGRLTGMPQRDRFRDLDLSQLSLVELPCEERHGFVWVTLTPGHPIDVEAHLGALDAEIGDLGVAKMTYYSSLAEEPIVSNWKSVAEGLLEGIHVPHVHAGTFNMNPQAAAVDIAFYDAFGPHVRYGMPMFGRDDVARFRATPEADWKPEEAFGCIWFISPGLLLANELYGLIYADLTPGPTIGDSIFRYGWLSPVEEPPAGMPSPAEMAARAARGVAQDKPVWIGCSRGLRLGAHGHALIGRNEKGVQLFHERLAGLTGYTGLDYC
jgi:nitrite reductase/ring-hydroxylating ferredoxin subunit